MGGVRLGVIGPCRGNLRELARVARHLLDSARADRVLYLGDDSAMDLLVAAWAAALVGGDERPGAMFQRAATVCAGGAPEEIDAFIARERARLGLRVFHSLPVPSQRTLELLAGRVVLLVYDKAELDEEDIAAASCLVYGRADAPLMRTVGTRTFVAPGPIGEGGGAAVLDDDTGTILLELMDMGGQVRHRADLGAPMSLGKMRVQGG